MQAQQSDAATCTLQQVGDLPEQVNLLASPDRRSVMFVTRLRREVDGAPNAYSPSGGDYVDSVCTNTTVALDHICNGVTVRDASGAIVPPSEILPTETRPSSRRCLATFREAQSANYPECGRHLACVVSWPGIVREQRTAPAGYQIKVPSIRGSGPYAGYYISKTTLGRPDTQTAGGEEYLDARRIPYVVVPGASALTASAWGFGSTTRPDLALVVARRDDNVFRAVFAIVGGTGPAGETGEVSAAVLSLLRGEPLTNERPTPEEIPGSGFQDRATIILFPHGAASPNVGGWPGAPISGGDIHVAGQLALQRAGGTRAL
ncbi:MAG TPA: hypothetical protein VGD66_08880 [Allosphingosinicella sp.]